MAHSQSRAVTPVMQTNLTPEALQAMLKQFVREGRWYEAFQKVFNLTFSSFKYSKIINQLNSDQALSVANLNMVLFVCRQVDSKQLFSATPCILPQPCLLSLIQQLSADLGMSTDIKLE